MKLCGLVLAKRGWHLHTGNCTGADQAFASGANEIDAAMVSLWLPWPSYELEAINAKNIVHKEPTEDAMKLAEQFHPKWEACKRGGRSLHARNMHIILGKTLDEPVDMIICWTKNGLKTGGTSQALRLAENKSIKVYNLAIEDDILQLKKEHYA